MLELTKEAEAKSLESQIQAHLILEIEGIDEVFGAYPVKRTAKIGDKGLIIGDDWKVGGVVEIPDSRPYISLTGSSQQLSQQLEQDRGGSGSIGSLTIELIDKADMITELVSKQVVKDLLDRKATVYYGFKDTSHPKDSVRILCGIISDIRAKQGSYVLTIQHPEAMKKTSVFSPAQTELVNAMSATDMSVIVKDASLFPSIWRSYIKIDDEWMKYSLVEKLQNNTWKVYITKRGDRGTIAAIHDAGADITTGSRVFGDLVNLALTLMITGADDTPKVKALAFNQVSPTLRIPNAVLFQEDIKSEFGLVVGDLAYFKLYENDTIGEVLDFGKTDFGYYVVISGWGGTLETSTAPETEFCFNSKYNLARNKKTNEGLGISPSMIDIEEHFKIQSLYGNSLLNYNFFLSEEIEAQELINEQIYFPAGLYQLPRLGKISLGLTRAPLADNAIKIDASNILNASEIEVQRSKSKYYYSVVKYLYEKVDEEDKYLRDVNHVIGDTRGKKDNTLRIECKGLRVFDGVDRLIDSCATRFLNRYSDGATYIPKVVVNFKTGFRIDIGDCVLFGDPSLRIADMKAGTRNFEPRLMEVVNKKLDFKTGRVELALLDTNFEALGRYGVIAPSGIVASSGTHSISFCRWVLSKDKTAKQVWSGYIGQHIEWHNDDWSRSGTAEILGFDELDHNKMIIANQTGQQAQSGDIVSPMRYSPNEKIDRLFKRLFCYLNPTVNVLTGISSQRFTVSDDRLSFFKIGSPVLLHNDDWTQKTEEVKVLEIIGNEIVTSDLGLIPDNTFKIELIGFADGGAPYRLV